MMKKNIIESEKLFLECTSKLMDYYNEETCFGESTLKALECLEKETIGSVTNTKHVDDLASPKCRGKSNIKNNEKRILRSSKSPNTNYNEISKILSVSNCSKNSDQIDKLSSRKKIISGITSGNDSYIAKLDSCSPVEEERNSRRAVLDVSRHSNRSSSVNETILTTQQRLQLDSWGLPTSVLKAYKDKGITSMFKWQMECLMNERVLSGGNLVYSAPTSAGKTLVAEILTIKSVLENKKKAIIILPFVSVVREKMFYLQNLTKSSNIRVEGFMGGHAPPGGFKSVHIAVCTIEKANSLVNRLMEEGCLNQLGVVVVDELHLLGDPHRGYLLELLLTKIQYMCLKEEKVQIQIIGMSATLPNLNLLADWLHADLYKTSFRPVPLKEYVKVDASVYDVDMKKVYDIQPEIKIKADADHVVYICLETITQGHSILIFCPSKTRCEKLAEIISKEFCSIGNQAASNGPESPDKIEWKLRQQLNSNLIAEVLEQLRRCPVGLDSVLAKCVSFGVAFHHAGLTLDERDIIEGSFRQGILRVLVATSTLSSGVNLPARRVIIRSPLFFGSPLDTLTYRQMVGRAGRMGVDTAGESFLICQKGEKHVAQKLVQSELQIIESCLGYGHGGKLSSSLKRAILEVVASGVACTPEEVECYTNCTLLAATILEKENSEMKSGSSQETYLTNPIKDCIQFLDDNEFIRLQSDAKDGDTCMHYVATQLGLACLAASVSPDVGLILFQELQRARQCFVLENELHIIYQVTPLNVADQWDKLDWLRYLSLWEELSASMRRVGELVGVEELFIIKAMRGTVNTHVPKQLQKLSIHRRFYTALALQDLVNEVPLNKVAQKFGCSRGMLQNLQQSASTFAGMVTQFCKQLGWSSMELLVSQFQDRLQFGVQRELCDLMRLSVLNGPRARALFNVGITSLAELASADISDVENGLHSSVPFESCKELNGETEYEAAQRKKMKTIWVTGMHGLTEKEAAEMLVKEARTFLQRELGAEDVKWAEDDIASNNSAPTSKLTVQESDTSKHSESNIELVSEEDKLRTTESSHSTSNDDNADVTENSLIKVEISNPVVNSIIGEQINKSIPLTESKVSLKSATLLSKPATSSPTFTGVTPISVKKKRGSVSRRESVECLSPLCQDSPQSLASTKSPSLFGDSFTVDTQLGIALDESYGSVKKGTQLHNVQTENKNGIMDDYNISPAASPTVNQPLVEKVADNEVDKCSKPPENKKNTTGNVEGKMGEKQRHTGRSSSDHFPETPKHKECCEELDISFGESLNMFSGEFTMEENAKNSQQNTVNMHRDTKPVNTPQNIADDGDDDCITDSFLDRAFNTYMTLEPSSDEEDKVSENKSPEKNELESSILQAEAKKKGKKKLKRIFTQNSLSSRNLRVLRSRTNKRNSVTNNSDEIQSSQEDETPIKRNRVRNVSLRNVQSTRGNKVVSKDGDFTNSESSVNTQMNKALASCKGSMSGTSSNNKKLKKDGIKEPRKTNFLNNKASSRSSISKTNLPVDTASETQESFNIINVCGNKNLFDSFMNEINTLKSYAVSIACMKKEATPVRKIGAKVLGIRQSRRVHNNEPVSLVCGEMIVVGIAFSWGSQDAYYMAFQDQGREDEINREYSTQDKSIALSEKVEFLQSLLDRGTADGILPVVSIFDLKEQYKILYNTTGISLENIVPQDPKVADWMLNPSEGEKNLRALVLKYCPEKISLLSVLGQFKGSGSIALNAARPASAKIRASVEAIATYHIVNAQRTHLVKDNLIKAYSEVEMPIIPCIARMEVNGIGFCKTESDRLKDLMEAKILILEEKAYELAGHVFSLTSPRDIAKVLYQELHLSVDKSTGKVSANKNSKAKMLGSTSKDDLKKLVPLHPLPGLILEWRKINVVLTKVIFPVSKVLHEETCRIYGSYITHTATGRISMHEPSLQNVPRDFDVDMADVMASSEHILLPKINRKSKSSIPDAMKHLQSYLKDTQESALCISMRMAFTPSNGNLYVAADYSQLELRILAHLSQDVKLSGILNSGKDVFCNIAAVWKRIDEKQVTPPLRQQAKQICYGMLYGMGSKALGEQLDVDENEAAAFMDTFKSTYPGVKRYMQSTVESCRKKGYVETVLGRRRYLPDINSTNPFSKAHAERQAVNSTIQGSAADIVKTAMILIDSQVKALYPNSCLLIHDSGNKSTPRKKSRRLSSGGFLVLHLHDELMYEVAAKDVAEMAQIVKSGMEGAVKLSVHLPVKISCGDSWGSLKEMKMDELS